MIYFTSKEMIDGNVTNFNWLHPLPVGSTPKAFYCLDANLDVSEFKEVLLQDGFDSYGIARVDYTSYNSVPKLLRDVISFDLDMTFLVITDDDDVVKIMLQCS